MLISEANMDEDRIAGTARKLGAKSRKTWAVLLATPKLK
jgi:hypothetical protein